MSLLISPYLIARIACAGLAVNLAAGMVEPRPQPCKTNTLPDNCDALCLIGTTTHARQSGDQPALI
ncbi:hypothetical protein [Chitinimonas naiadis]